MNVNEWLNTIEEIYRYTGRTFKESERSVFGNSFPNNLIDLVTDYATQQACLSGAISFLDNLPLPDNVLAQYNSRCELIIDYFVHLYENGETFGEVERIKEIFGSSITEKYNITAGLFFDFAKTYWTFKVEVMDLFDRYNSNKLFLSHILLKCEVFISQIFFPSPGPESISESESIKSQKEFLKEFSPSTNISEFISSNPMIRNVF